MSEEVNATETTSFADHLKADEKSQPQVESEAPAAVETPAAQVEQPKAEAEVKTEASASVVAKVETPAAPGIGFVPVSAVQAERAKRQAVEQAFEEFKQQNSYMPAESAPPAQPDLSVVEQRLRQDLSEQYARKNYTDYDDKLNAFASEVWDAQTGTLKNQALYEQIMSSPLPAEAAYKAGVSILEAKKLGGWDVVSDPVKYRQAVEKQIRADIEKETRQKIEAELSGKALSKSKTITDISQARTSGGATEAEFVYPSMAELLRQKKR